MAVHEKAKTENRYAHLKKVYDDKKKDKIKSKQTSVSEVRIVEKTTEINQNALTSAAILILIYGLIASSGYLLFKLL